MAMFGYVWPPSPTSEPQAQVYSFVFGHLTALDIAAQAGLTKINGSFVLEWASHELV